MGHSNFIRHFIRQFRREGEFGSGDRDKADSDEEEEEVIDRNQLQCKLNTSSTDLDPRILSVFGFLPPPNTVSVIT